MTQRRTHLIVLVGIPGSGKTTYAHRLLARCRTMRAISPDLTRERLYPGYERGLINHALINQQRIFGIAYREVSDALSSGVDVLFDATNLTIARRRRLIRLAWQHNAVPIAHYFTADIALALHRNRLRHRRVPTSIIMRMFAILQPPTHTEGFVRVVTHR